MIMTNINSFSWGVQIYFAHLIGDIKGVNAPLQMSNVLNYHHIFTSIAFPLMCNRLVQFHDRLMQMEKVGFLINSDLYLTEGNDIKVGNKSTCLSLPSRCTNIFKFQGLYLPYDTNCLFQDNHSSGWEILIFPQ